MSEDKAENPGLNLELHPQPKLRGAGMMHELEEPLSSIQSSTRT